MERLLLATALVVLAAGVSPGGHVAGQEPVDCSFPVSATDATGVTVTVPAEPDRVVVLAPSAAQTMWAIGAREKVVGMPVNRFTAYLEDREGVRNVVGDDGQPIQEVVVDLEPDLVLAPNVISNETVGNLRDAGLRIYRFSEARSLEDVYAKTELTGLLVGEFEAAARTSAETRATVAAVRDAVASEEPPRVYYALGGGFTAGNRTFISELIEAAGGENVAVRAGVDGYEQLSGEVLAEQDPEVIVVHEGAGVPDDLALRNSTALAEGNVVRVDANFINQPGPRLVVPLRELAAAFHPDAYAAADVENASVPQPTRCAGAAGPTTEGDAGTDGSTPTATAGTTDGASGAGLTAWQAALALAVLLVLGVLRR